VSLTCGVVFNGLIADWIWTFGVDFVRCHVFGWVALGEVESWLLVAADTLRGLLSVCLVWVALT
jgi:hypothetical protein